MHTLEHRPLGCRSRLTRLAELMAELRAELRAKLRAELRARGAIERALRAATPTSAAKHFSPSLPTFAENVP
jgi:hypothetical protein